jgi:four helix bundle protein
MPDILQQKAYAFALRVVRLSEYLHNEKKEYVLSRKIIDSGTNIALFIEEGKQGENRPDFIQKYSLANKEAFKSNLLIRLLHDAGYLSDAEAGSLLFDCGELQGLLISSLRTARKNS